MLTSTFGSGAPIVIQRTTSSYHGWMAAILIIGYGAAIIWNLSQKDRLRRVPLLWILAIGILVQFGWEAGLLLGGIRSAGFENFADKILTLVTNSLLETNLGMPYIYLIFIVFSAKFTERLKKRTIPVALVARISENNSECVRGDHCGEYLT